MLQPILECHNQRCCRVIVTLTMWGSGSFQQLDCTVDTVVVTIVFTHLDGQGFDGGAFLGVALAAVFAAQDLRVGAAPRGEVGEGQVGAGDGKGE